MELTTRLVAVTGFPGVDVWEATDIRSLGGIHGDILGCGMARISVARAMRVFGFGLKSGERLKVVGCRVFLVVRVGRQLVDDKGCEASVELFPGGFLSVLVSVMSLWLW